MPEEGLKLDPVVVLSKYFTWAAHFKSQFEEVLPKLTDTTRWNDSASIDMFMFMSHWYATLYVCIEGWHRLKLSDPEIDQLLSSPNVKMLKAYRHAVYHFQDTYFDQKYMPFMNSRDSVAWVRTVHVALFRYLDGWFATHKLDGSQKKLSEPRPMSST